MIKKFIALAVTSFCTVLLIYGENLIISAYLYGLGDLSRPVQSLNGFIGCNLNISVMQYLVLYVLFKFIAVFCIGTILSLIAVNTKNIVSFYSISAILLVAEGVAYIKIHPLSIYSFFRYINLIALTKVNEIFCNYKNINFWEYPVSLIPASIGAVLVISLICVVLSAFLYAKKRNLEFRKIGFKFKFRRGNKIHSRVYYSYFKSLVLQKGIIVIFTFFAVAGLMSQSFVKKYDISDVYYQYYCENHEGEITPELLDFCDSEAKRFDDIQAKIDDLSQDGDYSSELNDLYKQLAPSLGFYMVQERIEQVKDVDRAQVFYDTGYKRAFGMNGYDDDMKYALAAMLICIFCISPLIANDNKYRMSRVINATASGRKSYIRRNVIIASIYGLIAALLWIVPYAFTVSRYYGHSGLSASIRSIIDFADFTLNISVRQYILMIIILRTISIIFASLIMLWISSKCRNTTYAVLINFAVFALPVLVYLLGADFMVNIGFNPLLSVNVMFNGYSVIQLAALIVVVVVTAVELKFAAKHEG